MVQSDEVLKAGRFSGLELTKKKNTPDGGGGRKGKSAFAMTFNAIVK